MVWKPKTNVRGPRGNVGPQGLPGTGAVPADAAVAGYVSTTGTSATKTALLGVLATRLEVDVRDFGAVGDGVADDTEAIQSAVDAAYAGVIKEVRVPNGIFVVSQIVAKTGVTLRSDGGTLKAMANSTSPTVHVPSGSSDVRLVNLDVDGNAGAQTTEHRGVLVEGEHVTVTGCSVRNTASDGIVVAGNWVTINNCSVITTGRYGITIQGTTSIPAEQVVVHGNRVEDTLHGAYGVLGVAHHAVFSSNTARNCGGDGIAAYNAANRDIVCVGNTFHGPGNHGIHLGGDRLVIANNTCHDVGLGHGYFIRNHDASVSRQISIMGNTVIGTPAVGGTGVRVEYVEDVVISGNSCKSAAGNGIWVFRSTGVVVSSNVIRLAALSPIEINESTFVAVSANFMVNSLTPGINGVDSAAIIVADNLISGGSHGVKTSGTSDQWQVSNNKMNGITNVPPVQFATGAYRSGSTPTTVDGIAPPTASAWLVGDTVRNTAPASGGPVGWVCVTAGTPGTWKAYGSISA